MEHIEPDELAVLAVDGEEPSDAVAAHLERCAQCRGDYESFAGIVAAGRGGAAPRDAVAGSPRLGGPQGSPGAVGAVGLAADEDLPSPSVWQRIHGELGLDPALAEDPITARLAPATTAREVDGRVEATPEASAAPPTGTPTTTTTASDPDAPAVRPVRTLPSRARWWTLAAAAAVIGIVAGVTVGLAVARPSATQEVLARATLDPFPGWDASGDAIVEQDDEGRRSIVVDLDVAPTADAVQEVWLIRSDASGLVSLGLLDGASGRFALPADIDLGEFTIVDVSAEPLDGVPAHSGDSIVRGDLN
ncbi:anti-sigma factor [Agromyces salentinus]|uniref:Anti-sigma K factor RskA C-terminal domain-containing protein n=1 Tax=Agromyces salentinus TaxID=269421 RepID=A0ABN2N193_9MICO|nr:anti-sigma factor [Agromyces salentinus]